MLTLYGLGTIVGAGIFVLIGPVAGLAGGAMPASFVLAALIAGFTALSYAELGARFPQSAGEAVYVDRAFGYSALVAAVGYSVIFVGITSAATIVRSFNGYFAEFYVLPGVLVMIVLVTVLGAIAIYGIGLSVKVAGAITVISIVGLGLVLVVAFDPAAIMRAPEKFAPGAAGMTGIFAGAFLAFYAFIGFEDIVNLAEEVKTPERSVPIAIIAALVLATLVYLLVAVAAVTAVPIEQLAASDAPLAAVMAAHGHNPALISLISLIAVTNGALVQIIMASRVLYGLSARGLTLRSFGDVSPRTRTPVRATLVVVLVVGVLALSFPLVKLASATSAMTLVIFVLVNASLVRLRLVAPAQSAAVRYPLIVPLCGMLLSGLLLLAPLLPRV